MKKYLIGAVVLAIAALATNASAATGTGSTSTGTNVSVSQKGPGGIFRAWNYTTSSFDMVPQCFPGVFRTDYLNGNIFGMYENQRACQAKRAIDFKL